MEAEMRAMEETMTSVSGMKERRWKVDAEAMSLSIALRRGGKRVSRVSGMILKVDFYRRMEREVVRDGWWELGRDVLGSFLNWIWSGGRIVWMKWIE